MKQGSLLLVDDDRLVLEGMADWLREKGFDVAEAASCREARSLINSTPFDLVLADIRLQDGDGFEVLAHCRDRLPEATVILVTGYATAETGIEAIRAGAFDLLTKPLIDDELELAIGRALSHRRVIEENAKLKAQLDLRFGMENVVGHDHRMLKMFDMIDSVADTRATVLITGESGTGKSLIARAIHRRSGRRDKPFVEVACGALPETLLESELFGHVAGAFTGAMGDKIGKFKQSDGGTIFLDEISTASPNMQVKLLRVLQELEFEPVGGSKTIRVDTRVILATNEDLARAVAAGRFRQDLYYRINVINIELPPLRSRSDGHPLAGRAFPDASTRRNRQEGGRLLGRSDGGAASVFVAGQRPRIAKRRRASGLVGQEPHDHPDGPPPRSGTGRPIVAQTQQRADLEGSPRSPRAADHPGDAPAAELESERDGRAARNQSDDALQENETPGPHVPHACLEPSSQLAPVAAY